MTAKQPSRKGNRTAARLLIAVVLLISGFAGKATAEDAVEVFTDSTLFQLSNARGATVYDLSAPNRLNLGQGLPRDPQAAEALAKSRASANLEAIRSAYSGLAKAAQYRIAKIPAILFNHGEAVVYGQTDVSQAMDLFARWHTSR